MPLEHSLITQTHGRYLVETGDSNSGLIVGFHGYAEAAEHELARLNSIKGAESWKRIAIQALHRFYRGRSQEIVASWMTRQDREFAIADNLEYVRRVIETEMNEGESPSAIVFSGFSQGVAMAYRAACALERPVSGVIALGGDIPPELNAAALARIPNVLIGRGTRDEWYSEEKLAADEARVRASGARLRVVRFDGGHEWHDVFATAVAEFLSEISLHTK